MTLSFLGGIWDMSGTCLEHHLGHVWAIIWSMSGACLWHHRGQSKMSAVLCASRMPFLNPKPLCSPAHNIIPLVINKNYFYNKPHECLPFQRIAGDVQQQMSGLQRSVKFFGRRNIFGSISSHI